MQISIMVAVSLHPAAHVVQMGPTFCATTTSGGKPQRDDELRQVSDARKERENVPALVHNVPLKAASLITHHRKAAKLHYTVLGALAWPNTFSF